MPGLTFVGTGEAFDPELGNTSVLYEGSRTLLLDCGYSVPHGLWRITRDPSLLDALFVSHRHADHAFGVPALLSWMSETGRTRPLDVLGGPELAAWLDQLLELAYPGTRLADLGFPVRPIVLDPTNFLDLGPVRVRVAQTRHGVPNLALRLEETTTSVCYSGDGALTVATSRLFDGATVLVHECYAVGEGRAGHARLEDLLELKRERAIQTLCLVHPGRDHKDAIRLRAAGIDGVLFPGAGDQIFVGSTAFRSGGEWV